ncbi:MAG: right-handed parallel beta-helix repeat-containing protein, partial [Gloeomargarita sp. HHBFW_bins_205]
KQNIAINEGGGIYFTGGVGTTLSLKDQVLIEGNQVQADAGRGAGIFVGANGALQFPPPATPGDANKVKITDNQAVGNNSQGGGIFSEDNWQILPGLVNPVNVEIKGNRAARGGGFVVAAGKIVTLGGDVKVQDNQSTGVGGGGIYVDTSGTLILKGNVQVTGNRALNVGKGGGLFAAPLSNVTLKDNTKLQGNQAGKFGGAIFADLGSQLLLQDNVLLGGTPGEANVAFKGGGIYANQVNQLVLQDNVKVIGNKTPNAGGAGIYAADTNNFILQGNVQIKANEAGFFGAGIRLQNSTANLQGNVQVIDNIADVSTGRGGGIYAGEGSNLNIANNVQIQNNTAFKGGGIYVDGSTLAMTDNALVSGNQTPNAGGAGIFAFNGTVNLAGAVQINNNTAAFFGGGVRLDGSSTLISQGNVKFLSNTAQFGGGIYVGDTSSASLLGVTEVRNNTATDGGGIFKPGTLIIGPTATVTSNTPNDVSP